MDSNKAIQAFHNILFSVWSTPTPFWRKAGNLQSENMKLIRTLASEDFQKMRHLFREENERNKQRRTHAIVHGAKLGDSGRGY